MVRDKNPPLKGEGDREAVEGYQRLSVFAEADTPPSRCARHLPSKGRIS
jgi:hypothetical protein